MTDLCRLSATDLAALIRTREVSPVEVARQSLARIERAQPILNAFAFIYPDEALELARAADVWIEDGSCGDLGPALSPRAHPDLAPDPAIGEK